VQKRVISCDDAAMMVQFSVTVNTEGTDFLSIGDRLRAERLRLGYTQPDFASIGGVSKNTLLGYEKGNGASPAADFLAAIHAVGADVMFIVTGQRSLAAAEGLAPEEVQLLEEFRQLAAEDQNTVSRIATGLRVVPATTAPE
jgi:transcriptional regulator with XRE-family HTH domain